MKIDYSLSNGLGKPSVSLYLTGCDLPIKCKGCHNWELQKEAEEKSSISKIIKNVDKAIKDYSYFNKETILSILGGEPMTQTNREITLGVSRYVKENYKKSTIILYSWRNTEDLSKLKDYIKYIDYGVLGVYDERLHRENTIPSSANQYIYDFKNEKVLDPIILKR